MFFSALGLGERLAQSDHGQSEDHEEQVIPTVPGVLAAVRSVTGY